MRLRGMLARALATTFCLIVALSLGIPAPREDSPRPAPALYAQRRIGDWIVGEACGICVAAADEIAPRPALPAADAGGAADEAVPRPAAPAADAGAAARALRELFAQLDPPAADRQIEAVLATCGREAAAVRKLIASDAAYERIEPGWQRRAVRITDGKATYDVEFTLHVPPTYRPDRPHAVLLAAHGQNSNGRHIASTMLRVLGPAAGSYVILAPTMPGPPQFSGKSYQEQAYLQPLQWVRRNLNVDDDRVCLAGYSQGGHCTWHLAALFPRHFAAAVSMAGTPWFEGSPHTSNLYLENLSNLPLWALWGELDKPAPPAIGQLQFCRAATGRLKELGNTKYRGTELPGVGHGGSWADPGQFAAFLAAGKRTAAPDKFAHFFHLEHHRRGYYLEALELSGKPMRMDQPIRIKFTPTPGDPQGERAAEAFFAKYLYKMWGELNRADNAFTIRTSRIRSVRVYVTEGMFDLARPVTLRFAGCTWRGQVNPSALCLLRHYADDRDAAAPILNEIDFYDTGRAVVRYP